jgi:PKD repeat protein
MKNTLKLVFSFLLLFIFVSCEKAVVDADPLFSYKSTGDGNVIFTPQAKNAKVFEWDFGDGSAKSEEQTPTHQYQKNGEYTVILIAKNKKSQVVSTQKIKVSDAPKPIAKFSYKSLGNGLIEFTNETKLATGYDWFFGDGESTWVINPKHQYKTNGTYEVKLVAKSDNGQTTVSQNITIADAPKPIADFSFTLGGDGYAYFTNSSSNASSYQWSFGDGSTSNETSPTKKYSSNGTYSVTLTAKNSNGENTSIKSVSISSIYVPTTGQAVFWTSSGGYNILVYINGNLVGTITKNSSTVPSCGTQGFVTVNLPAGAYSFTAKEDRVFATTWSGTVNITNGQCRSMKLNY